MIQLPANPAQTGLLETLGARSGSPQATGLPPQAGEATGSAPVRFTDLVAGALLSGSEPGQMTPSGNVQDGEPSGVATPLLDVLGKTGLPGAPEQSGDGRGLPDLFGGGADPENPKGPAAGVGVSEKHPVPTGSRGALEKGPAGKQATGAGVDLIEVASVKPVDPPYPLGPPASVSEDQDVKATHIPDHQRIAGTSGESFSDASVEPAVTGRKAPTEGAFPVESVVTDVRGTGHVMRPDSEISIQEAGESPRVAQDAGAVFSADRTLIAPTAATPLRRIMTMDPVGGSPRAPWTPLASGLVTPHELAGTVRVPEAPGPVTSGVTQGSEPGPSAPGETGVPKAPVPLSSVPLEVSGARPDPIPGGGRPMVPAGQASPQVGPLPTDPARAGSEGPIRSGTDTGPKPVPQGSSGAPLPPTSTGQAAGSEPARPGPVTGRVATDEAEAIRADAPRPPMIAPSSTNGGGSPLANPVRTGPDAQIPPAFAGGPTWAGNEGESPSTGPHTGLTETPANPARTGTLPEQALAAPGRTVRETGPGMTPPTPPSGVEMGRAFTPATPPALTPGRPFVGVPVSARVGQTGPIGALQGNVTAPEDPEVPTEATLRGVAAEVPPPVRTGTLQPGPGLVITPVGAAPTQGAAAPANRFGQLRSGPELSGPAGPGRNDPALPLRADPGPGPLPPGPAQTFSPQSGAAPTADPVSMSASTLLSDRVALARHVGPQITPSGLTEGRTQVTLRPDGLGAVEIELKTDPNGRLSVLLRVENPTVLQALREERNALLTGLEQSGLDLEGCGLSFESFEGGEGERRERSGTAASSPRDPGPETPPPPLKRPRYAPVIGGGRIDILT